MKLNLDRAKEYPLVWAAISLLWMTLVAGWFHPWTQLLALFAPAPTIPLNADDTTVTVMTVTHQAQKVLAFISLAFGAAVAFAPPLLALILIYVRRRLSRIV